MTTGTISLTGHVILFAFFGLEAKVERFYEDLQDLLELTPPKDVIFIIEYWNAKVGS